MRSPPGFPQCLTGPNEAGTSPSSSKIISPSSTYPRRARVPMGRGSGFVGEFSTRTVMRWPDVYSLVRSFVGDADPGVEIGCGHARRLLSTVVSVQRE